MSRPKVTIYTDGACKGNPGPGGWGAILMSNGHEKELYGYDPQTTNNRMEMMAAIAARFDTEVVENSGVVETVTFKLPKVLTESAC